MSVSMFAAVGFWVMQKRDWLYRRGGVKGKGGSPSGLISMIDVLWPPQSADRNPIEQL